MWWQYLLVFLGALLFDIVPFPFAPAFTIMEYKPKKAINNKPIVLVGKAYWGGLVDWIKNVMLEQEHNIHAEDLNLFRLVDTAEEAAEHIFRFYDKYVLKPNF